MARSLASTETIPSEHAHPFVPEPFSTPQYEYEVLFENAGIAVVVIRPDGMIERANQVFLELFNAKRHEVESRCHFSEFVHPRDRVRVQGYHDARLKNPASAPLTYEFSFVRRSGDERLCYISVNPISSTQKQICCLVDITEKWKLEQEVRNKEQFLTNILRYSVEAIVAMDPSETIRSWNQGAEMMFGYKAREVLGKRFSFLLPPETRRSRKFIRMSKQFHSEGVLRDAVLLARTKEGRNLEISITRTAIRDQEGKEIGSSAIVRDMTEHRRLEKRMIQQEKMLALGELAASLAHEVKNPLNSMVINMEVLKSHFSDLEENKRKKLLSYAHVLTSEIERLNKVMRGVLDFARPMEGTFGTVDLEVVISHVRDLVKAQAERGKTTLEIRVQPNLPKIEGVEDHLKQILLNLLLNSFQAMPEGGKVTLKAACARGGGIDLSIADTGVGIPRRHYRKIFDLYFSTKEKGSGLGLALVKRLVTANNGTICFRSRMNHGTTFTINFPAI